MTSSVPVGGSDALYLTGTEICSTPKSVRSVIPGYEWDRNLQRYRDSETGRFVSRAEIDGVLNSVMQEAARSVIELTRDMVAGRITPEIFGLEMGIHLKNGHICATALAHGGIDRVSQSDWGRLGNRLKGEFAYLRNWVTQLEGGIIPSEGQAVVRANMYVLQTFATYEGERRRSHIEHGAFQLERRVLDSVHPCSDCVEYSNQGWVPIGTLPEIGDSECDGNCRCHFEYTTEGEPNEQE